MQRQLRLILGPPNMSDILSPLTRRTRTRILPIFSERHVPPFMPSNKIANEHVASVILIRRQSFRKVNQELESGWNRASTILPTTQNRRRPSISRIADMNALLLVCLTTDKAEREVEPLYQILPTLSCGCNKTWRTEGYVHPSVIRTLWEAQPS